MFTLTIGSALVCGLAALGGGFIDAVSGGGGIVTISALLLCGVPPHYALGTNKFSAFFGISISFYKYARSHLVSWRLVAGGVFFIVLGSFLGASLALYLDQAILGKIILALLPFAIIALFLPSRQKAAQNGQLSRPQAWGVLPVFCLLMGGYDGFFGPGSGTFILLGLHWLLGLGLLEASATTKPLNLASNICSATYFMVNGVVHWQLGAIMAVCFMLGGWAGTVFAIHVGAKAVRRFLLLSLLLVLVSLAWRYLGQGL